MELEIEVRLPLDNYWDKGQGFYPNFKPVYNSHKQVLSYEYNENNQVITRYIKSPLTGQVYKTQENNLMNLKPSEVEQNQAKNLKIFEDELDALNEFGELKFMVQFDSSEYINDIIYFFTSLTGGYREMLSKELEEKKIGLQYDYNWDEVALGLEETLRFVEEESMFELQIEKFKVLPVYVQEIELLGNDYYIGINLGVQMEDIIKPWIDEQEEELKNVCGGQQILEQMSNSLLSSQEWELVDQIHWIYIEMERVYREIESLLRNKNASADQIIRLKESFFLSIDPNTRKNQGNMYCEFSFELKKKQQTQINSNEQRTLERIP